MNERWKENNHSADSTDFKKSQTISREHKVGFKLQASILMLKERVQQGFQNVIYVR